MSNSNSKDNQTINHEKRTLLKATTAVGTIGVASLAIPLVSTLAPSEKAKAAGAPIEIDISGMKPGEIRTGEWRGKPIWIIRRTEAMLSELEKISSQLADPNSLRNPDQFTPIYARNIHRSIKPEYLVAVGICTHLGCSPVEKFQTGSQPSLPDNWPGGFLCPCHGSTFDLAGRVFKNKPAPDNLEIPPHRFIGETRVLIGEDKVT